MRFETSLPDDKSGTQLIMLLQPLKKDVKISNKLFIPLCHDFLNILTLRSDILVEESLSTESSTKGVVKAINNSKKLLN